MGDRKNILDQCLTEQRGRAQNVSVCQGFQSWVYLNSLMLQAF